MSRKIPTTVSILCLAGFLAPLAASAQTANSSPTSGSGADAGSVTRTAPSGGTAQPTPGKSQIGAPTPLEQSEEEKSQKDTTICKGC